MSATIIPFSETTGIVKVNAGYTDICSIAADDLRAMMDKIKPGQDIRLGFVPHEDGSNVFLMKSREADYWIGIAPAQYTSDGRVQRFINRVMRR